MDLGRQNFLGELAVVAGVEIGVGEALGIGVGMMDLVGVDEQEEGLEAVLAQPPRGLVGDFRHILWPGYVECSMGSL